MEDQRIPLIATEDTLWPQNHHGTDDLYSDGLEDLFPGKLEDIFASVGALESVDEPLLIEEDPAERPPTATNSSLDFECAGVDNGDGDDDEDLEQAFLINCDYDFSSPEHAYYDKLNEVEVTDAADVAYPETLANEWPEMQQEPSQQDEGQPPQIQDDMLGIETRGRPRRASIRMICRAGEVSSLNRSRRPVQRSDSSWDEQDNLENFGQSIKILLDEIGDPNSSIERYFVTDYLTRKKRHTVHVLARLGGFNHITLDETKERRVLVTTASIRCKANHYLGKCWNNRQSAWKLDPRTLILMLPANVERDRFVDSLAESSLPIPASLTHIGFSQQKHLYLTEFDTVGAAATFLGRLRAGRIQAETNKETDPHIEVAYRYWSQETSLDATFDLHASLNEQQSWSDKILVLSDRHYRPIRARKRPPLSYRSDWSRSFNQRRMSRGVSGRETDSSDGYGSSRSRSSSKRPYADLEVNRAPQAHLSVDLKLDDLDLQGQWPSRDASAESTTKRTKRLPKQVAGYICGECGKAFDFAGERTKHARIHKPKAEWPHACEECEQRFNDKKDLMRHKKVHLPRASFLQVRGEDNGWRTA